MVTSAVSLKTIQELKVHLRYSLLNLNTNKLVLLFNIQLMYLGRMEIKFGYNVKKSLRSPCWDGLNSFSDLQFLFYVFRDRSAYSIIGITVL